MTSFCVRFSPSQLRRNCQQGLHVEVDIKANKTEIKQAIETIFDVKVERVNTVRQIGKVKRMGLHSGRRAEVKKAYVKLTESSKPIAFFEAWPSNFRFLRREFRMAIKFYKPTSPGRRFMSVSAFEEITCTTPEKSLLEDKRSTGGRNVHGKITVRFRGGAARKK